MDLLRTQIALLNNKYLKNVASFLYDEIIRSHAIFKYIQCYHVALRSIELKIYKT